MRDATQPRPPMRTAHLLASSVAPLFVSSSLALAACGGAAQGDTFPPHLDIPVAPDVTPPPPPQHAKAAEPHAQTQGKTAAAAPAPIAEPAVDPQAVVAAADRDGADKALDAGRHPAELLAFLGLTPGMRVAELGAGGGYTTELLARTVGPKGKVWAQNSPAVVKFVGKAWTDRLAKPVMRKNVVRVDRDFDAPLPPDAKNLDAVVAVLAYHDTVWLNANRDKMNKAVFAALKPGAEYVIVDHASADGHGIKDVKTLHRIEESTLTQEIEKAGFKRAGNADFLRNPQDTKDWNAAPNAVPPEKRGTSDRFVLKFIKPQPS
jgi:predicted methyltransferase